MSDNFRYLQLNEEKTEVIGESFLLGEVDHPLMILDNEKLGSIGMGYDNDTGEFSEIIVTEYEIDFVSLVQNDVTLESKLPNMYYPDTSRVEVEADCKFKGNVDTSLELPLSKTPIVRYADGSPTTDEFYGVLQISQGKLTGYLDIPKSGDWRIEARRINNALKVFNVDWQVAFEDIHLIV